MRGIFFLLILAATGSHVWLGWREAREVVRSAEAREGIRRLAMLSVHLFQGPKPPTPESFWREINRSDPLLDPWGRPYRLQIFPGPPKAFEWFSTGSDGVMGSPDDLKLMVPYGEGAAPIDFTKPELDLPMDGRVNDAR